MSVTIHPLALVESGAELGADVSVGPFCTVSKGAKIGARTRLVSHVVIDGTVEIGEDNIIQSFCAIGTPPQDLTYKGENTKVVIGDRNHFHEACTVHRATLKQDLVTRIGSDNFIMVGCHIAHDCVLGNRIIMANQVLMAGHSSVGNFVNIGGIVGIAPFARIGDYCFIGGGTVIRKDLPPYMCAKEFSEVSGPNLVGLKRVGTSEEDVRIARELFKTYYLSSQTAEKAIAELEERFSASPFARRFIDFLKGTKIGIQR